MLVKYLTGRPGFMANVTDVNEDNDTVVFAHCTIPLSITEEYEFTTHFETGLSLGVRGSFPAIDVTIIKVGGEDLAEFWVGRGRVIENIKSESGCRTQIRVKFDGSVRYFLYESLANHHIIVPGDYLERFAGFLNFALE